MINAEMREEIRRQGLIAVLTVEEPDDGERIAAMLLDAGIGMIELTLRTPRAIECMERIHEKVPEMVIGAGTVISEEQIPLVMKAGAKLAVSPGLNPAIVRAAGRAGLPFAPGVMTPSDVEMALSLGLRVLKFYHAGLAGGLTALKSLVTPYRHLEPVFIPLGGVNEDNLAEWIADPIILAAGGSWIATPELITRKNWTEIDQRARRAVKIIRETREK